MNTTFSFNRLGLLIKRYFIENKQRELSFWGIVIVVFMIMHQSTSIEMFLYVTGFIFAARMFKVFNYTPGGMHYLLIPATHVEKLVTTILLSTVYYFSMILITYTIGNLLGTALGNAIFSMNNPVSLDFFQMESISKVWGNTVVQHRGLVEIFFTFALIQSIFLMGSVYFKKNAIGRTIMTFIVISISLGIIEVIIFKLTFGSFNLRDQSFNLSISGDNLFPGFEAATQYLKYLMIPFFWLVSYFKLTEKQV
ncbi:MAG: hypothetical protein PHT07_16370 [Paludibacter sp.]|nr:hypothetical protein [Paludibacter sp.]